MAKEGAWYDIEKALRDNQYTLLDIGIKGTNIALIATYVPVACMCKEVVLSVIKPECYYKQTA